MPKSKQGGGAGSFFRNLLLLALIGAVAYNTWEVVQLKSEVAALKPGGTTPTSGVSQADGSTSLLGEARSHLAKAEEWAHVRRYDDARKELTDAAHSFTKTNADTRAQAEKILSELRSAANHIEGKEDTRGASPTPSAKQAGDQ